MNLAELVALLNDRSIELSTRNGELVVRGKKRALTAGNLVELLREHKAALIELIEGGSYVGPRSTAIDVPPNRIPPQCEAITPEMLPLVAATPEEIGRIVSTVPGGAANVQDIYPLAPLQEGILFHHLMAREGDPYLLRSLVAFDSRARLESYLKALQAVIDRHDILRTAVVWKGLAEPVQVVWRNAPLAIEEVALDVAAGDIVRQLGERFDPRRYRLDVSQAPLLRVFLAKDAANGRWVMLRLFHHLVIDHTAMEVMQREVRVYLLGQEATLPVPLPFRNFVAQARLGVKREEHEAYFKQLLSDVEEPTAPFGMVDVQGDGSGITEARLAVDKELARRLRERARALGVSAASLCHLAYAQVLARVSGRDDVVFGTVLFGRMQGGEGAERVMGLFINTLPVRIRVGEASAQDSVKSTHAQLAELMRHEHASLALAQRCSAVAAPAPLFSALLNYRHNAGAAQAPSAEARRAWEGVKVLGGEERTNYPLLLSVDDLGEGLGLTAQTRTPIDPARICGYMHRALGELVGALERAPATAVRSIDVLPESERRQAISGWNRALSYPKGACLHERFERQVERTPEAVALVFEGERLTYAQLNARANRLAHRLRALGVGPDQLVGLRVERGAEMVVGILGILKAGGAYLPLDPAYPKERIAFMLEDSRVAVVVAHKALAADLEGIAVTSVILDEPLSGAETNPAPVAKADNLAYVIYTSGSTGKPKGAQITHYNVTRLFEATQPWYGFDQNDVWTLFHSYAFDFSVWELWGALLYGGRVVIVSYMTSRSPEDFRELLISERITVLNQTPSAFRQLIQADLARPRAELALRYVIFGGEALELQSLRPWFERYGDERPLLVNMYGITETTVHVTYRPIRRADLEAGQGSVIGEPIPDLRVYILDPHGEPAPIGVPGELYVGGAGVARGYLNRAELTAQRFVADRFNAGQRLYRTGDLARRLANGDIEYLGRIDEQVKVRGFRIELGEIESALGSHPALRETVVLAREDTPGDKRLVAYVVATDPPADLAERLRAHLRATLPEYMVPSAFVTLDALPLTPNGKVDRRALPAPEYTGAGEYVAPRNATEESLAAIWAEVLKVERVGVNDNFFELGGHSLLAVTLIERMRRAGLNADVRALFTTPTLAELAAAVGGESDTVVVPANGIPPQCEAITPEMLPLVALTPEEIGRIVKSVPGGAANVQDIYPLAPLQEGILFHHLMAREGDPYLLRSLAAFDTRARLDGYLKALQAVVDRHDILRTGVVWEGLSEPVQVVWRNAPLVVEEVKLDPAKGDIAEQLRARFDPRRYRLEVSRAPLLRVFIAEDKANARWVMLRLFHHLAIDHTALEVMQQEVRTQLLGEADKLPKPLPFRNFVAQAKLGVKREEHEAYFKQLLSDVEEPTAPFGLVDVQGDGSGITEARRAVNAQLAKRLRERARALGVSAASLCHLAYAQVLARVSGRDDVVFGTVLFGRMQGGEGAERVMGLFINTLPVRIRVGEAGVEESVRSTHAQLAQLLRHEHASLALAQRCSAVAAPAPLFSSLLNYRHSGVAAPAPAEARQAWEGVRSLGGEERTNYPFVVSVDDLGEGFAVTAQMQSPMDPARICDYMLRALDGLARALESAPATAVRSIDVLPGSERRQLLIEWNATKVEWPRAASVMQIFEEQAERTPDAVAVVFGDQRLTFRELNARANQLARYLQGRNVQRDTLVAICVERSLEMAVGLLGILKAGGAYVPLDPTYPAERLEFLLQDTGAALLLTQARLLPRLPAHDDALCLDSDWHKVQDLVPRAPRTPIDPEQLAYVIYTSGSTGKPKGVCITHRGLFNYLNWAVEAYKVAGGNGAPVHSSFAFDLTITSFFAPLLAGRPVHLLPEDRSVEALADALRIAPGYSLVKITPAHLQSLQLQLGTDQVAKSTRSFIIGGEQLEAETIAFWRRHAPDTLLVNEYGPTETVVGCCVYTVESKTRNGGAVPIGRPIANTQLYILDRHMEPVPIGVVGELYIGGHGVARGYWNQAALTAERFVPDPFSEEPGARLYRTGDLARYLPDGNIEFLGRIDTQVKVRGYRIELGEIESTLSQHPAVGQAVVVAREDEPGDKRLVAYVVGADAAGDVTEQLRAHLRERLPEYMVPSAFVVLEALPLTPNGKVDRKALPAPEYAGAEYVAPRTPTEQTLAAIWAEVLKVERVGVNDNFFELGGHSLLAVTLIARMRRVGLHADVRALFTTPTLAEFAQAVGDESDTVEVPPNLIPAGCEAIAPEMLPLIRLTPEEIGCVIAAVPGGASNIQDIYPLAPLQEGILFHHLMAREGDPYLLRSLAAFDSRARLDNYLAALQAVIDRHDILRTGVVWEGLSEPVQVVWRNAPLVVEEVKLDASVGDAAEQLRARFDPRRYRLDVSQAPLLRAFIAEDKANARWVMLRLFHHLAIDHTALEVMQREVRVQLLGEADKLPIPLPFRNFVAQARLGVKREEHEAYFRKLLGDVEEPTAPFGMVDVQGDGTGIVEVRRAVDRKLAKRLRDRARALGVSAASLCHLAYAQVLARTSGRDDVVFGTVLFGRMQGGEGAEQVMGLFINTLPVRIRIGAESVEQSVKSTHAQLAQLLRHEHASLAVAQRASGVAAPAPLFSALLNYRHIAGAAQAPNAEARRAWEGMRSLGGEERSNYPMVLSVEDLGEGIGLTAQTQSPVDPARICGYMQRALEELVVALERSPTAPLRSLDILLAPERDQLLLEWNATQTDYPREASIGELFEAQAELAPDAVALEFEGERLSYKELNSRANRLAHYLAKQGVGAETRVGLCVERSVEMVVATLGVLKAGGAYVPLDPDYPQQRLAFMLEDTQAPVLLTQERLRERLPVYAGKVIELDTDWTKIARESAKNPRAASTADSLAYVIYTSGSTGRPKGTLIEQRSVVRLVKNTNYIELGPEEVFLQFAPISFDASTLELWGPLLNGGRLVIAPPGRLSLEELGRLIEERGVTTLWLTAALFNQMVDSQLETLRGVRQLLAGGEALSVPHVRKFLEGIGSNRLINGYGPTENTTFTCCHVMGAETRIGHTVPIGRPISNTRVYVLDARREPVPVGVYGELYIGGDGLARGYLNQPELTEEKFVPDPFSGEPGVRLYRTGDLVRYTSEGLIEFLGRVDTQVKVRGFRIELGEIEYALSQHPAIREAVVLAREDSPGDKRLVAYVVAAEPAGDLTEQLRAHLRGRLPEYMVPSAFVALEALPLTPVGKVDRRALPAPEYAGAEYVAPRTPTEEKLAAIWAEVLKVERVGIHDNFFELGGHSLLAVTLIERMRRAGLHADVRALFTTPTLADLAAAAGGESTTVEVPPNLIPAGCEAIAPEMLPLIRLTPEEIGCVIAAVPGGASNIQDIYPLAPLQEGILFHHLMARAGDPYLLRSLAAFDTRARLDGYLKALQSVIDRHDILRTGVVCEGLTEPVQVVWRKAPLVIEEVTLDAAAGDIARQLAERFDPRRYRLDVSQAPLLRIFVAEDAPNGRWLMLRLFHHLAIDHTAAEVMQQEVRAQLLGEADKLPKPLPFRNFVAQTRLGVSREEHEAHFKKLLGDVEEPTAPFGLVDVQGDGSGVTEARLPLEAPLARRLRERARALGVSAAALCHLAYAQVLARTSGRDDVVFGTVLFGRMQGGEGAERVLGLFINTLPVRIHVGDASVQDSVKSTHVQLAELLRHEHAPLALAQRASAVAAPAPLFSALLNYRHIAGAAQAPNAEARRAWEGIRSLGGEERTNYPLLLSVEDLGEGIGLTAQTQSPVDPARICGYMQRALEELVVALERSPTAPLRSLDILLAPERDQLLLEWNATQTDYPREASIGELFEAQAELAPDAVALEFEGERLSYKELNSRANRLAHYLAKQGVGAETRVGLCVERSVEMVVATLGVLKAGGAYVPLDPDYPQQRLAFMLEDTQAPVLLTQERLRERLPAYVGKVIELDTDWTKIARESAKNPRAASTADSLAYVIYTSGSTGRPKGTLIEHRSVVRLVKNTNYVEFGPKEVFLQLAPISFDASTLELWGPLLNGGRLVVAPPGRLSLEELAQLIEARGVSTLWLTAALFNQMVDSQLETLRGVRQLLAGGEALSVPHVRKFLEGIGSNRLINGYGPTENTTFTCCHVMGAETRIGHTVPIGRPISNTRVYVLDARREPVPVGVYGELYIGGDGLARGYLNQPELTEEKFVPDPFSGEPGVRLYRTGDLVRYTSEGLIEFLGRVDTQVKVRGFRIELGEIEYALSQHPAIREAVVLAREDSPGDKRLVAYVVAAEPAGDLTEQLRAHLRGRLPEYMVPSAFVALEALPLTPVGKVDRRALPAPEYAGAEYVAPRTPTEEKLAAIWAEVLKVERVGIHDNFFELGGDSILSFQVVAKAKRAGLRLRPKQIFEYQRLGELATVAEGIASLVAEQGLVTGDVPLTPIQHWFFEQDFIDPHHWNQAMWLEPGQELDPSLLVQAIKHLIIHHDALRMRFRKSGAGCEQFNAGADETQWLTRVDLSGLDEAERIVAVQRAAAELQGQLSLEEGPLLRAGWFDFGRSQASRFLIVIHHLVVDTVSWRILLEDLQTVCQQLRLGDAVRLPDKTTSFRQWAQRLTEYACSAAIERERDYWLGFSQNGTWRLPVDFPGEENIGASARTVSASLNVEETRTLLHQVPQTYNTQINDVLLSALAMTLGQWSGESAVGIYLEGHGREELFEGIDLSRSVGWFTTQFPVRLDLGGSHEPGDILKSVKAQLGRIPQRGIGFGLLRYSSDHEEIAARLRALPPPEVVFNYLGQFDQTLAADAAFTVVNEPTGPAHSSRARRTQLLAINGLVAGGRLQLSWTYSGNVHRRTTIENVAGDFMEALRKLIRHCTSQMTRPALSMEKDKAPDNELVSARRKKRKIELSDAIKMLGLD